MELTERKKKVLRSIVDLYIRTAEPVACSCYLQGEYGQDDIMIGVPAVIGRKGIEKIVKIDLNKEEQAQFEASAAAVRKVNQILTDTGAI